jgi:hypothetical protein
MIINEARNPYRGVIYKKCGTGWPIDGNGNENEGSNYLSQ